MGAVKSKKKSVEPIPIYRPESDTKYKDEQLIVEENVRDLDSEENSIKKGRPSQQLSELTKATKQDYTCESVYMILFLKEIGNNLFGEQNFPYDIVFHIASILLHRNFRYEKDFDENGILFWLGTFQKTAPYQHPCDIGLAKVNPLKFYCGTTKQAFSHEMPPAQNWLERGVPNSWAEIEFFHNTIIPTAYTLRHGYPIKGHAIRHWNFEARNPNEEWEILREHRNDTSIPGNDMNDTATFFLPPTKTMKQYSIFRIYQVAETENNSPYLMMAGFELYGYLF
jgi:hypothetical protein